MRRSALAPFAAALLLAGCAQSYISPVSVTRLVGQAPARLGQGPIAVRAAPGMANSLEFAPYRQAVAAELARLGYQVVAGDDAAQVAEVRVERAVAQPGRRRNPVSVGVGGAIRSASESAARPARTARASALASTFPARRRRSPPRT